MIREYSGENQKQMADALGVSNVGLCYCEGGNRHPSRLLITAIVNRYSITPACIRAALNGDIDAMIEELEVANEKKMVVVNKSRDIGPTI